MKDPFKFLLRGLGVFSVVISGILFSDSKGWFDAPVDSNPHILKRWSSIKNMHEKNQEIDVLVLGNSHAYTGINPKHLSAQLGMTSFVLANNSSIWTDSYWTLREALLWCDPQVVIIESYGLNKEACYGAKPTHLVNQIRAFEGREDFKTKLASTPSLFTVEDMGKAWSQTIRNHHYLWENREQIEANMKRGTPMPRPEVNDLYLGRFVRFTSGLTAESLAAYDSIVSPVQGALEVISQSNRQAAGWIADLCEERGIKLMVVTLPMYEKHVADADIWAGYIEEVVQEEMGGAPWLNLQLDTNYTQKPDYFENTLKANQHMTRQGSIRASNSISQVIFKKWGDELEFRRDESDWIELFHEAEGFYAYNCPASDAESPSNIHVIGRNFDVGQLNVLDASVYADDESGEKAKFLQFRLNVASSGQRILSGAPLRAQFRFRVGDDAEQRGVVDISKVPQLSTDSVYVFRKLIRQKVRLLQLESLAI